MPAAIAWALIILNIETRLRLFPKRFILEAQDAAENNDIEGLKDLCAENSSPAARIIAASLEAIIPGQQVNYDRLRDAMEA